MSATTSRRSGKAKTYAIGGSSRWASEQIPQPAQPLVICSGGTYDERTFLLPDWQEQVRGAEHLLERSQRPEPVLGYEVDPARTVTHRAGLVGMPATWIGFEHLTDKGGVCR